MEMQIASGLAEKQPPRETGEVFRKWIKVVCPLSSRPKTSTTMCFLPFTTHPTVWEGATSQDPQVRSNAHRPQISSLVQSGLPPAYSTIPDALNARDRRGVLPFAYPQCNTVERKLQCDDIVSLRQYLLTFCPGTEGDAGNISQPEVNKILKFKAERMRSALELVLEYMDQPHKHMFEVADTDTAALTLSVRTNMVNTDAVGQGPGASLTVGGVNITSASLGLPPNAINVCDDGDETRGALPTDLPYFWYNEPQPQPVEATNGDDEDVILVLPTDLIYFWPT
ncbi:hypothetical protein EXIGLDRAFT_841910 [Exidia glandulosa HHB12029]|uniref:Uncharacterized protein n=1 Tax=Exidia glandulosa HHB12029 TaxID=1314781 RepID=A0A165DKV1_EXIGL|nr:hypothetical protein EXIGLDRAFT_841910 [Exidia glandulosa HHB12029]